MSRKQPDARPASFESAFLELQRVVERLEDGSLELEQALQLFERGNELAQTCQRLSDDAELRVTRLTAEARSDVPPAP